jgi:DNA-binding response OmpR family regulator
MAVNCLLVGPAAGLPGQLATALAGAGYTVAGVAGADVLRSEVQSGRYALGLVLHAPPRPCAFQAMREIRLASSLPCVVVGGTPVQVDDRVAALDAGADEVLDAGTPVPEAVARIRAVLRRSAVSAPAAAPKRWRLSHGTRRLERPEGGCHRLTTAEFDLLQALVAASGAPVDRDAISRQALGRSWQPEDRSVDGLVKRLRRKLGSEAIQTARGRGYALAIEIHSR